MYHESRDKQFSVGTATQEKFLRSKEALCSGKTIFACGFCLLVTFFQPQALYLLSRQKERGRTKEKESEITNMGLSPFQQLS